MIRVSVRGLLAHKIRFLMTSFAVVLGVSFVVGSMVVTDTVRRTFDTLFAEINSGIDLEVRSASSFSERPGEANREPMPDELVAIVAAVEGVAAAEGAAGGFAQPIDATGEPVKTTGAPLLGFSWGATDELYPVTLAQGSKPDEPGEIAIDESTFADYEFSLGQQVDVLVVTGRETFTLVGTARFGTSNSLAGARLTYFTPGDAQRVFQREGVWDLIEIDVVPGADVDEVAAAIQAVLPDGTEVITGEVVAEEGSEAIGQVATVFGNVLLGFAAVALFVSAFYIYNTFSIILGQRVRELGLLRAVGASASQVRGMVLTEAALVGAVASVIGIGAGMVTAQALRGLLNAGGFGLPADALVLERSTIIAALVVGMGVTLAAAFVPARTAGSVTPITAIREGGDGATRSPTARLVVGAVTGAVGAFLLGFGLFAAEGAPQLILGLGVGAALVFFGIALLSPLAAEPVVRILGAPIARLLGQEGHLAQNAARNPYRTASTASALVIGLALVTMALVVGTSIKRTFEDTVGRSINADFVITEAAFTGFTPTLAAELRTQPELAAVTGVRTGSFRFVDGVRDVTAFGPQAGEIVDLDVLAGGSIAELGTAGILVHEDPATDLGLSPGDTVALEFARTGDQTFTVVGVYADATLAGNYVISMDAWDAHFTDGVDRFVMATTAAGVDPAAARRAVEAVLAPFPHLDLQDRQQFLDDQVSQIDQILVTVNALLLLAVIIAVLGIGNTLALSVFERTRELGLLRAVGMSRRQMRRMIRWESAIVSLFGAGVGVVVGVVFGVGASSAVPDSVLTRVVIPGPSLVILVLVAMVAGLGAAILPARRAARLDVLTAIASE